MVSLDARHSKDLLVIGIIHHGFSISLAPCQFFGSFLKKLLKFGLSERDNVKAMREKRHLVYSIAPLALFLIQHQLNSKTLCAKSLQIEGRNLYVEVSQIEKESAIKALLIESSNREDPIRAKFSFRISDDGKALTSEQRVTGDSDKGKGFQKLLSNEVAAHFPNIEKYNASLTEDSAIALMQNALSQLTGKKAESFVAKDSNGLDLAINVEKKLRAMPEAQRMAILREAAKASPEYKLARSMMGEIDVKSVNLELHQPKSLWVFYSLKIQFEKRHP